MISGWQKNELENRRFKMSNKRITWFEFFRDTVGEIQEFLIYKWKKFIGNVKFSLKGTNLKDRFPLGNAGIIEKEKKDAN